MRRNIGLPLFLPALILGLAALAVLAILAITLRQPWLGLQLGAAEPGWNGLLVESIDDRSPTALAGLSAGQHLAALSGIPLVVEDLTKDPGHFSSFAALDAFYARQAALAEALRSPDLVQLETVEGQTLVLPVLSNRPLGSLPAIFWGQIGAGLMVLSFGAWVLSHRRDRPAEGSFFLAGCGLTLAALATAVTATRELALPEAVFRGLAAASQLGALVFGIGLLGVFLSFPLRIGAAWWRVVPVPFFGGWWLASQLGLFPDPVLGAGLPLFLALLGAGLLALAQIHRSRNDPRARAALRWIGVSALLGAGTFVATIVLPGLVGVQPKIPPGVIFLFLLPVYGGFALGVARFRLFELQDWAFRVLFYMGAMGLLVLIDAALLAVVALDPTAAFGLSLLVVGLLYMPLRDRLGHALYAPRRQPQEEPYRVMAAVALAPTAPERLERWTAALRAEFLPLALGPAPTKVAAVQLVEDGAVLELPGVDDLPPMRLVWARAGRALFSQSDRDHAVELLAMLRGATESRRAYESGAAEERIRIARDMHDNIGIQLTGALHSTSVARKDALIREALTDLREIISNADRPDHDLAELLADLRASLSEHVAAAGMALDWPIEVAPGVQVPPRESHALRSVLREAVGNAIRHSRARRIRVDVRHDGHRLRLRVEDDGIGLGPGLGALPTLPPVTAPPGWTPPSALPLDRAGSADDAVAGGAIAARVLAELRAFAGSLPVVPPDAVIAPLGSGGRPLAPPARGPGRAAKGRPGGGGAARGASSKAGAVAGAGGEAPVVAVPVAGTGHGLVNMRARVAGLGGWLEIGPRPGGGLRIEGEIPYQRQGGQP